MALIFTPGQLTQRSEFYHQLGQLLSAGISLPSALEEVARHPPSRAYREPIHQLQADLSGGYTFAEAVERLGSWVPSFDQALISAGEHSGRLDAGFRLLADYYSDRARIARQMIADLAYPVFLFHFAVFIFPFPKLFQTGNWWVYGLQTFGVLLPIYAILLAVVYASQGRHGELWRSWVESLVGFVPILGKAQRYLALARLSAALEALLSAGVSIIQAWELAAAASGSPALRRAVVSWKPQVDAGQTPAEVVRASSRFPEMFVSQYSTGEISGRLDDTLRLLHRFYQEEGTRKLHAVAQWTPRAVYLFIVLMIAFRVVRFWTDYFGQVQAAGGF